MKKKKIIKKLSLGKNQISNLGNVKGGAPAQSYITCETCAIGGGCGFLTEEALTCFRVSEANTACTCQSKEVHGCVK
ncbi:hypothetical protein IMCC3317_30410 [Kordia antarctica]|uniref:Uncharacterized protein n=1 Tax=Kordia antarctica TaxID=1218801 RepID=A0A7L4ZMC2_9FLAO|nr:hypothetical protein [Kordia antarctica]QHI37660.1 hypothetical protein IMCC3317_30410 [Kordia antarctica]